MYGLRSQLHGNATDATHDVMQCMRRILAREAELRYDAVALFDAFSSPSSLDSASTGKSFDVTILTEALQLPVRFFLCSVCVCL
jgi:hypothetical protein